MDAKEVASLVGDWGFEVSGSSGSSLGALWELSGSSLGALWELVAVAHIWGTKVTHDISHPIRFHASKEVARQYLGNKKKNSWPNKQFDKVDLEHLDLVL